MDSEKTLLKLDFKEKQDMLKSIRHEIKKRRFILDETVDKFGFDELTQLTKVTNTSENKGYPFSAGKVQSKVLKGLRMGLKVVPIESKYEKNEHPCNLEHIALKELTDNIVCKNISPHIAYYLGQQKISNKSRAIKFLNLKRLEVENRIRNHSSLLMSEFVEGNSLDNWVYDTYENDGDIKDWEWKNIVFQLTYTLAVLQHYYKMMHNDCHCGNILIDNTITPGGYFVYKIKGKTYYIKNNGIIPKLWDFEFSMIYSNSIPDFYPNKFIVGRFEHDRKTHKTIVPAHKTRQHSDDGSTDESTINVPYNYNEFYDLHYFLTTLLDLFISQELFEWILEIYPEELIPKDSSESGSTVSSGYEMENSDVHSDVQSESKSFSTSESDDSRSDYSSSSSSAYDPYLSEGRIKCDVEQYFKDLPTPLSILDHSFFDELTKKPADFDEQTAIYFKAGF